MCRTRPPAGPPFAPPAARCLPLRPMDCCACCHWTAQRLARLPSRLIRAVSRSRWHSPVQRCAACPAAAACFWLSVAAGVCSSAHPWAQWTAAPAAPTSSCLACTMVSCGRQGCRTQRVCDLCAVRRSLRSARLFSSPICTAAAAPPVRSARHSHCCQPLRQLCPDGRCAGRRQALESCRRRPAWHSTCSCVWRCYCSRLLLERRSSGHSTGRRQHGAGVEHPRQPPLTCRRAGCSERWQLRYCDGTGSCWAPSGPGLLGWQHPSVALQPWRA